MRTNFVLGTLLVVGVVYGCGGSQAPAPAAVQPAPPDSEQPASVADDSPAEDASDLSDPVPAEPVDVVDCSRIDDPDYRLQVEASGIDPDTIDCHENDTGG